MTKRHTRTLAAHDAQGGLSPAVMEYADALLRSGKSELWATRALKRRFPSLEHVEAWRAVHHVPEPGLWARANVEWGFGPKSPGREYDPVRDDG